MPNNKSWNTVEELKAILKAEGFDKQAILSADEMEKAQRILDYDPTVIKTPGDELRYIEGLLDLPMGFITEFKTIPKPGYEKCKCGRIPTALDLVSFALKRQVHGQSLIRDTLIGFQNLFELAEDGRSAQCIVCGRMVVAWRYYKRGYMYA